jgi:hypothetical protein
LYYNIINLSVFEVRYKLLARKEGISLPPLPLFSEFALALVFSLPLLSGVIMTLLRQVASWRDKMTIIRPFKTKEIRNDLTKNEKRKLRNETLAMKNRKNKNETLVNAVLLSLAIDTQKKTMRVTY